MIAQNNDCRDTIIICSDDQISFNPDGPGEIEDLNASNQGCLASNENSSAWYYFELNSITPANAELGFTLTPDALQGEDYDFAVYGPNVTCEDLGQPIRCSFADGFCTFCPQTGLGMGATDFDDADGDGFVANLQVNAGEGYFLIIDNYNESGSGFSIEWTGEGANFLNCLQACDIFLLPIEDNVCGNTDYEIDLQVTSDVDSLTFVWEGDPTSIAWLSDPTVEDPIVNIPSGFSGQVTYTVTVSGMDNECFSSTDVVLNIIDAVDGETSGFLIREGESIEVNGEEYTQEGSYSQVLQGSNGCDSVITINVEVVKEIVHYDLNACDALVRPENNADYSEFISTTPSALACASTTSVNVLRRNPETYMHSCTPGVDNTFAMCVSSMDDCNYSAGDPNSIIIDVTLNPEPGTMARLSGVEFYEKAPETYEWIGGLTGPNNWPTQYGIRVLKNGIEIYQSADNPTTSEWTLQSVLFSGVEEFTVTEATSFTIELLGYCLEGNGAEVSAWDIDEISILGNCELFNLRARSIGGEIATPEGQEIKGVYVNLLQDGSQANYVWTQADGSFQFPNNPIFSNYTIQPEKDDHHLNGISTYDLVLIQKHLLGIETLDSPYKYIAADVNNSKTITAMDMLELRKLILGINKSFPNNTSWRFPISSEELSIEDPFNYKESIEVQQLEYSSIGHNFTAVKIGDLNGTALNYVDKRQRRANSNRVVISFNDQDVVEGQLVTVQLYAHDFEDVNGLQMSIRPINLDFQQLIPGQLDLDSRNIFQQNEAKLNLSYTSSKVNTIEDDQVLFTLQFIAKQEGKLSEMLHLNNKHLNGEIYKGENNLEIVNVDLEAREVEELDLDQIQISNTPNPFTELTTIQFALPNSQKLNFTIYDLDGKEVYQNESFFERGMNQIEVDASSIQLGEGMYIYKIEGEQWNAVSKMILVK